jgi:ParB family chromosome partitioning protein
MVEIAVDLISNNPHQPRHHFDETEALALQQSIERYGLLEPIGVRAETNGSYQLVYGERRLRAVRALAHETIACIIVGSDVPADEVTIIENLQRVDLNPFEAADAIAGLMERHGYSQAEIARLLGLDKAEVSRTLSLRRLPEIVRREYHVYEPPMSALREIAKTDQEDEQLRRWAAYKGVEDQATGASSDNVGKADPPGTEEDSDSGNGRQRPSIEPMDVALSTLSKRVARHFLSVRNALYAMRDKRPAEGLADTEREMLREMRSAIDAILEDQVACDPSVMRQRI